MPITSYPSRPVAVNVQVVDQFAVFAANGVSKIPGLNPTLDFAINVWNNGVLQPAVVIATVITEILTTPGEYQITWTPTAAGFWEVEVQQVSSFNTWRAGYQVPAPAIAGPSPIFYDTVRDARGNGLPFVTVKAYAAGTANLLSQATTDFLGNYNFVLAGALSTNLIDLEFSGGGIATFRKDGVRLS